MTLLATYNLQNGGSPAAGYAAVHQLLDGFAQPAALVLIEAHQLRADRAAMARLEETGWDRTPASPTIFYRPDRLHLTHYRLATVAAGRRVGYVPGRRTRLPAYRVAVARFAHHDAGHPFTVIGVHTPAHNRWGGGRAVMFREEVAGIARIMAAEHAEHGGPVYAGGDWNRPLPGRRRDFAPLRRIGAVSCWDDHRNPPATRAGETIDGWFALGGRFVDAYVPHLAGNPSDHRPVLADAHPLNPHRHPAGGGRSHRGATT